MRRTIVVIGLAVISSAVLVAGKLAPPPGATAQCRDGTYSYSQHHSGTCSYHGGVAVWLDGSSGSSGTSHQGAGTSVNLGSILLLGSHTKSNSCRRGPEPDRGCSPGAIYSGLTKAVLCSGSFSTGSIRNVPQSEKFAVEQEYGMPATYYGFSIEIDHIVPLELGGSNAIVNLFPEPGSGLADYHVKDRLENRLHAMVCAGSITLRSAQTGIARDWEAVYRAVFGVAPTT
jgi:Protein of unknown function (DUF3761)